MSVSPSPKANTVRFVHDPYSFEGYAQLSVPTLLPPTPSSRRSSCVSIGFSESAKPTTHDNHRSLPLPRHPNDPTKPVGVIHTIGFEDAIVLRPPTSPANTAKNKPPTMPVYVPIPIAVPCTIPWPLGLPDLASSLLMNNFTMGTPVATAPPFQPVMMPQPNLKIPAISGNQTSVKVADAVTPGRKMQSSLEMLKQNSSCTHFEDWKRLRIKKGMNHMLCRECGAKWKCPGDLN